MNQNVIDLEVEKRARIPYDPSFQKSWGIRNPTTSVLRIIDRNGSSAVIRPTRGVGQFDSTKVYFYLSFNHSGSSNFTTRADIKDSFIRKGANDVALTTIDLSEIESAKHGVYIRDLDLIVGVEGRDLIFPETKVTNVIIEKDTPAVFQYFYNSELNKDGRVLALIHDRPMEVECNYVKELEPGLYAVEINDKSSEIHLIDESPLLGKTLSEINRKREERVSKEGTKREGIDISLFNKHLDQLNGKISAGINRIDDEIVEGFKSREMYRKDVLDVVKTERAIRSEDIKLTSEGVKTTSTLIGALAKVL